MNNNIMCNNYEVIVVITLLFCRCEIEMNKKLPKGETRQGN